MKLTTIICCLLSIAVAVAEKQIQLEDIERDNLANERTKKQENRPPQAPNFPVPQKVLTPSPMQFGFSPLRAQQAFAQQQQQQQRYVAPQTFQYTFPTQQYTSQLAYPQLNQFADQKQYAQYENVPYLADNRITQAARAVPQAAQTQQVPQYYQQQYVYLQPYTAASNNIQMVVDPKGNVKYYMYVPAQVLAGGKNDQGQDLNALLQFGNVGPQLFTQEPDYPQSADGSPQYITQPQLPPQPQVPGLQQQVRYAQQPVDVFQKSQYAPKGEPQSLLDSYVPSLLQVQYYKQQQQAQANAIQQSLKGLAGRPSLAKQPIYVPGAASQYSYAYQLPPALNQRGAKP